MTGQAHLDLDVLLGRSGSGYQAQILRSPAGEGQQATFARPFTDLELENFVLKVSNSRMRTRRVDAAPVAAAKQFGGRLFEAIFDGAMGECLRRSIDYARDRDATLRIRLRLSGCPELADLPWELLYDRGDDWFLALSDQTPVIRYVQLPQQPRAVRVELPLRVLVIKSEPVDCPRLDFTAEWGKVAAALARLTDTGALALVELAAATLSDLRQALLHNTFHVLHYMGHGAFDAQRGGVLLFTDRSGHSLPVTSGDLGVLLRDHTSMRLAILNACEAGRTDPADPFAGVADTLVRRGIPAVVAMQFEVTDEAAIEFAPALYGALAAGLPVDAAVAEARKAMYTVSPLEWATPVLYLRADDARLFDITTETPPPAVADAGQAADPGFQSKSLDQPLPGSATDANPLLSTSDAASQDFTLVERGDGLYDQHRCADAEVAYRTALAVNPSLARAHTGLSRALRRLRRYPEAEAACREAIRLDPASALAHSTLGAVLLSLKQYPEAEAACREAIRLDPASALAHSTLGAVLLTLKRYPEAEAGCLEAIRLDPSLAVAHNALGLVLQETKRYPEAEAACREAIRLDPSFALAHNNLGRVLRETKRDPEAEAAYREAIRLDPSYALAHFNLGVVVAASWKRHLEAEAAYREAARLDPSLAVAHNNLGVLLKRDKQYAEAEAAYREAIRADPSFAKAHKNLGDVLYIMRRYKEADASYQEATRLDSFYSLFRNFKRIKRWMDD